MYDVLLAGTGAMAIGSTIWALSGLFAQPTSSGTTAGRRIRSQDEQSSLAVRLEDKFRRANLPWGLPTFLMLTFVCAVGAAYLMHRTLNNPFITILSLVMGGLPYEYANFIEARRRDLLARQVPSALAAVTNLYLATGNMFQAFRKALLLMQEPLYSECNRFVAACEANSPFDQTLQALVDRLDNRDFKTFAAILLACRRTGAEPSAALKEILRTIQQRQALRGELNAETAATRGSVYMIVGMGILQTYLLVSGDEFARKLYRESFAGRVILFVAVLITIGVLYATNKITKIE